MKKTTKTTIIIAIISTGICLGFLYYIQLYHIQDAQLIEASPVTLKGGTMKLKSGAIEIFGGTCPPEIDYSLQSLVEWDDYKGYTASQSQDYQGEESTWTVEVASEVWQDQRTGLYWTKDEGAYTNVFPDGSDGDHSLCPFFSDRAGYDGLDADCGNAINYCGALSKDDGGGAKTDWYLPSQKELMQAYIDGIYNQADADTSGFWSSTEKSNNPPVAWYVGLRYGSTIYTAKSNSRSVRCVRRD